MRNFDAPIVLLNYHIWRGTVSASDLGPRGTQNAGGPKSLSQRENPSLWPEKRERNLNYFDLVRIIVHFRKTPCSRV